MTRSGTAGLPVSLAAPRPEPGPSGGASFDAHLLGQPGARRGLRAGEPVLKNARAAYLCAQWRGEADRRPPAGRLRRVEA